MNRHSRFFSIAVLRFISYLLCLVIVLSSIPFTANTKNATNKPAPVQGQAGIAGKNVKPVNARTRINKEPKAEDANESTQCSRRDKECRKRKERKPVKKDEKKIGDNRSAYPSPSGSLLARLNPGQFSSFSSVKPEPSWLDEITTGVFSSFDAISDVPVFGAPKLNSVSSASATASTQCTYCLTVPPPTSMPIGSTITLNWSAPSNHSFDDWIGLYRVGTTNNEYLDYQPVPSGGTSGALTFWSPFDEGTYQFRYIQHDPNDFNNYLTMATSNNFTVFDLSFPAERLDPANRIGASEEDLLSGNFNWGTSLVNLPGRAGMDLNISLSYNSLVWTKSATQPYIGFDTDIGFPSPGFRLDFPLLQGPFNRPIEGVPTYFYLLILPSGKRVELRNEQLGLQNWTNVFLSTDGSHLRMRISNTYGHMMLLMPDGTRMFFYPHTRGYECERITDRNGNYIRIAYDVNDRLSIVTDTLGRKINFIYDTNNHLIKITQDWNNNTNAADDHVWATFTWGNVLVTPNFPGLTVSGLGGNSIPVITQVSLDDGSIHRFSYTRWGQVRQIEQIANLTILNTRRYNVPSSSSSPLSDCPRFSQRVDESIVYYGGTVYTRNYTFNQPATSVCTGCVTGQVVLPDGTTACETFAMNTWQRGLMVKSAIKETSGATTEKKKTTYTWTQDIPSAQNQYNPRVVETNTYDDANNRRRVETVYKSGTGVVPAYVKLPEYIKEYDASASTVYRMTHYKYLHETDTANAAQYVKTANGNAGYGDYNLDLNTDRWLFGLVTEQYLYEGGTANTANIRSKVTNHYDDPAVAPLVHQVTVNHSQSGMHGVTYASTTFRWRGNLSKKVRWDASDPGNASKSVWVARMGYNTSGSPLFILDGAGAQTDISYTDDFSNTAYNGNGTTGYKLAYPTKVTDPDGRLASPQFFSASKYDYNFGAVVQSTAPKRAVDAAATSLAYTYDSAKRVTRVENSVDPTNIYTRYEYAPDHDAFSSYTKIDIGLPETYKHTYLDGFGKVAAIETDHPKPGNVQRSSLTEVEFDNMGRVFKRSNPTEVDSNTFAPAGDDVTTGFIYTQQTYDWQGRPRITTNQDAITTQQISYSGCGCAGGQVITMTDERGRKHDVVYDTFGRVKESKTNYDMAGSSTTGVYTTTTNTYNVRDQVVSSTLGSQSTTFSYDGHGRLEKQHQPNYTVGKDVIYTYNADDTVNTKKDPRNVTATYSYNLRKLVTLIDYDETAGVATSDVKFDYDEVGNTKWMDYTPATLDQNRLTYNFDSLGRLASETHKFAGVGSFPLTYQYSSNGQLKSVTDPFGSSFSYQFDKAGQISSVNGAGAGSRPQYATNFQYRAWGALKHVDYSNSTNANWEYNARLLPTRYELNNVWDNFSSAPTTNPATKRMGYDFTYHDDGRLKFAKDLMNMKFDRSYEFDHGGRIKQAFVGKEARNEQIGPFDRENGIPYSQTFSYDIYNNITGRNGYFWQRGMQDNPTYNNLNQRITPQLWSYDDAGQVTDDSTSGIHVYDSASRQVKFVSKAKVGDNNATPSIPEQPATEIVTCYEGSGPSMKRVETRRDNIYGNPNPTVITSVQEIIRTTYYLRSSVLENAVIAEIDQNGAKQAGYIFANGERVAMQSAPASNTVNWQHFPYGTGSWIGSSEGPHPYGDGSYRGAGRQEMDPLGAEVGISSPIDTEYDNLKGQEPLYIEGGNPFDYSGGCSLDGIPIPCSDFLRRTDSGSVQAQSPSGIVGDVRHLGGGLIAYQYGLGYKDDGEGNKEPLFDKDHFSYIGDPQGKKKSKNKQKKEKYPPNPCAGKDGTHLDYSITRTYNDGNTETGKDHILRNHTVVGNAPFLRRPITSPPRLVSYAIAFKKSLYGTNQSLTSSELFDSIRNANSLTFALGTRTDRKDALGNLQAIIFSYNFPPSPRENGKPSLNLTGAEYKGAGVALPTNANTVILDPDCTGVQTSFPGSLP